MAETVKTLAQSNPTLLTLTGIYTGPTGGYAVGKVTICNRSAVATSYRIAVALAGAADDSSHYKAYDVAIGGNATAEIKGVVVGSTDVLRVYATLGTLTFNYEGSEVT